MDQDLNIIESWQDETGNSYAIVKYNMRDQEQTSSELGLHIRAVEVAEKLGGDPQQR